ncbi:hypothetical protein ACIRXL_02795 [Avibacterium paragallinarum]|uniref:hypothetical protein n=1 Tax=Avibacterium paragallinarum TaxID=728 RepID=UPI00397B097C
MKKLILFLFFVSYTVFGQDPFDRTRRGIKSDTSTINNSYSCSSSHRIFSENTAFQLLKLIGVIEFKNEKNVMFLDQEKKIMMLRVNDIFTQEKLRIEEISLSKVKIFDCIQSKIMYLDV